MTMPPNHEWTPERVKKLTKLWATGLSASEIGRRLGITKNAVVGKVRRLDLAMRRAPTTETQAKCGDIRPLKGQPVFLARGRPWAR